MLNVLIFDSTSRLMHLQNLEAVALVIVPHTLSPSVGEFVPNGDAGGTCGIVFRR